MAKLLFNNKASFEEMKKISDQPPSICRDLQNLGFLFPKESKYSYLDENSQKYSIIIGFNLGRIKKRESFDPKKKKIFLQRHENKCDICGSTDRPEIDHKDPSLTARGNLMINFNTLFDNDSADTYYQVLCKSHNNEKREVCKNTEFNNVLLKDIINAAIKDSEKLNRTIREILE